MNGFSKMASPDKLLQAFLGLIYSGCGAKIWQTELCILWNSLLISSAVVLILGFLRVGEEMTGFS